MKLYFLQYIILFLFFSGCEKIIDVHLNDVNPAIVIEGNLSYFDRKLEVNISKTGSYFGRDTINKVTGAVVVLENDSGEIIEAEETAKGLYQISEISLRSGHDYKLHVNVEGTVYTAVSTLNPVVHIDSLAYEFFEETRYLNINRGYRLNLYFSDPEGQENYYRIKVYKNGELIDNAGDIIVFDDSGINGKVIKVRLRRQVYKSGDRADVDMLSIDKSVWKYFSTLRDVVGIHPGSPAPANPVSNFNNGALGYFSAWSHDSQNIIIPKNLK